MARSAASPSRQVFAALTWRQDTWSISAGCDFFGRTYFINASKKF